MIIPVVLCGGSGTRLWPLSRQAYPKQFLSLIRDNETLLQATIRRAVKINSTVAPILLANEEHRFLVAEQIRQIGIKDAPILLEPVGRNTAPAAAAASFYALSKYDHPILMVMPSDHYFTHDDSFIETATTGIASASSGNMVTFGIVPDAPATGYGYIKRGEALNESGNLFKVEQFIEKPDLETAKQFVSSGSYYWNSGIFMFRADVYLKELKRFRPEIYSMSQKAFKEAVKDLDFFRLDNKAFNACPSDSIDYAVMEHTDKAVVIPLEAGWDDLGGWTALSKHGKKDANGNVTKGDVFLLESEDCYVHSESRLVATVATKNLIIVETSDAVLIANKQEAQKVKKIVKRLKESERTEAIFHKKVYRPWGSYETIDISDRFQVKRITVNPGQVLSLQMHHHRAEHWIVVKGTAKIIRGEEEILLTEDQSTYIPLGTKHRLENPGVIPLELIEVQTGSYLGEDDIVRFEDVYGRTRL